MTLSNQDLDDLRRAKRLLEQPSLAARFTSLLGTPIERGFSLLPRGWSDAVTSAAHKAIGKAVDVAVGSLGSAASGPSRDGLHKLMAGMSGAGGGAFGLPALAVELPLSTTIMLRSIADVARSEGEDVGSVESRLACVEVFALGGTARSDDATETGYFAVRVALGRAVSEAAEHVARKGLVSKGAPALVRLISQVSSRFTGAVSEKIAAQAVPALGAVGGATLNLLFLEHFQNMARGHFIVRRLERVHGADLVRAEYETLKL